MKRVITLMAALAFALCLLAGCGAKDGKSSEVGKSESSAAGKSEGGKSGSGAAGNSGGNTDVSKLGGNAKCKFEFDLREVQVTLDLHGGWSAEFGDTMSILYDGRNDGTLDAVAAGLFMSAEVYDEVIAELSGDENFSEEDGFILYRDSDIDEYILTLDEGLYYMIMVQPGEESRDIFGRFAVEIVS